MEGGVVTCGERDYIFIFECMPCRGSFQGLQNLRKTNMLETNLFRNPDKNLTTINFLAYIKLGVVLLLL